MSSFTYTKRYDREPKYAVRCDSCKIALFTDREGQEFPLHITQDAKQAGWKHYRENGKWVDYCPECEAYKRDLIRHRHFDENKQFAKSL